MSLSETREIMSTCQEIIQLLAEADGKVTTITQKIGVEDSGTTGPSLRSEFRVLNGYMIAMQRWSGSDTLSMAINKMQQLDAMILRGYMLMETFNDLYLASSLNPFLIAYAGAHAIGFAISVQNVLGQ